MPFCPDCKFEYRPDINKCPDCDSWLVADLNSPGNRTTDSNKPPSQHHGNREIEYPEHIKKLMKSLPRGSSMPNSPLAPFANQPIDNYDPDSNDPIAKKLSQHETWIEIAHLPYESVSRNLSDGLESLGIPCVIMPGSQRTSGVFGDGGPVPGSGASDILLVPEEFVERADIEAAELLGDEYENYKTPHE